MKEVCDSSKKDAYLHDTANESQNARKPLVQFWTGNMASESAAMQKSTQAVHI